MLEDSSITFDELVGYKLSTRLEFADRMLDDLFTAVDHYGSQKAKEARAVLEEWDREANTDSRGTLLFYLWASRFNINDPANYSVKWNREHPDTIPDGFSDPLRAVQLLEATVDEMQARFGRLDVPWGDFYRLRQNGRDFPANGDQLELFSKKELREAWFTPEQVKKHTVRTEVFTQKGVEEYLHKR